MITVDYEGSRYEWVVEFVGKIGWIQFVRGRRYIDRSLIVQLPTVTLTRSYDSVSSANFASGRFR